MLIANESLTSQTSYPGEELQFLNNPFLIFLSAIIAWMTQIYISSANFK